MKLYRIHLTEFEKPLYLYILAPSMQVAIEIAEATYGPRRSVDSVSDLSDTGRGRFIDASVWASEPTVRQ